MLLNSCCAGCRRPGPVLCRTCRFALVSPPNMAYSSDVVAAVPFAGRPRDVLLGFKYGNRRQLAHHFSGLLVNRLVLAGLDGDELRCGHLGANARGLADNGAASTRQRWSPVAWQRSSAVPCRRLLERDRNSVTQTGLARIERLHGPVFRASPAARGKRVLVIDDVVTTGSTLRSASSALRHGGAASVQRAAVATTPALPARWASSESRPRPLAAAHRVPSHVADIRPHAA